MSIPLPQSPHAHRLRQLLDVSLGSPAGNSLLYWDASSGRWKSGPVQTAGIADGAVTYAKLAADVPTTLDSRYVNVTGDTVAGPLTVNGNLTTGSGTILVVGRQNTVNEGGQIELCRASDNTSAWAIDLFGAPATPDLRIINVATVRMVLGATGQVLLGNEATWPTNGAVNIGNLATGYPTLSLRGIAGQTAEQVLVSSSAGAGLFAIGADGGLRTAGAVAVAANPAAAAVYKLAVADMAGTILGYMALYPSW